MICTCLSKYYNVEAALDALKATEMAEIRLDTFGLNNTQITQLFARSPVPLIATFRPSGASDVLRLAALKTAVIAGADYVDIELDAPYRAELMHQARENQCKIILSYHNFETTPAKEMLEQIAFEMSAMQPDYLKIVPFAQAPTDVLRVLSLYENNNNLLAFCMGQAGQFSRLAAYFLGAPFIYAAPDNGVATADGQLSVSQINSVMKLLLQ